ncbi:agmatinase family protein [Paenisporosarcina cavernae]|uniref:Formimidoylglutamase n=1 Tax=Paenisporosarcina cavernae TaxID=2320858 RepID=A0A385YXK3_9BACL|nr:agmatinase family protein [Paenisporosarcina cavernae]AYC30647.1 formimidoylglutamase [Paenisporosarcina cavernae]
MRHVHPSEWSWRAGEGEYVHHWLKELMQGESPDMILYGAPLSRSSISPSAASAYPLEFRKMGKGFTTYNLEEDIDLRAFTVRDAGDIAMHTTDILLSHSRIEEATEDIVQTFSSSTTCMIGGDHSVTACAVRGVKKAYPTERIGILQFDTHLDVRDPSELGPANGTPIRQLIDGEIVQGSDVINIGLHGYFNAASLVTYAKQHNIDMVTLRAARRKGVAETVRTKLAELAERVDRIYVTVDMDVLDIAVAPGVPASTPGGMRADELFDALKVVGEHSEVRHIDFVCLDPMRDVATMATVKTGMYAFLEFVTGRVNQTRGK